MNAESESIANHQHSNPPASDAIPSSRMARIAVDAQGLALVILATIALVFVLEWAQEFLIPLLLGILFAYTLNPLVVWLERIKIHRVAGASLVIVAVMCALVSGTYSLRGQMQTVIEQLPEVANQLSVGLARMEKGQLGAIDTTFDEGKWGNDPRLMKEDGCHG